MPSQNLNHEPIFPSISLLYPPVVVTEEPAKGDIDARGIIEERIRLGEVNEGNLPVVENQLHILSQRQPLLIILKERPLCPG